MRLARAVLVVCARELGAYIHAPIAYIVGVLFLLLQGVSFWAVVSVLADPARPAPVGAVLHSHFGGTFLYWTVLLMVVALIAMRLVAEERRQGTWESLLTAPVDEGAVIAGKWLGAVGFYALLWLPTLLYPLLLAHYAPPPVSIDPGPVAAAYLGVLLIGMALLAMGVAASAATANQIIAAVLTFVLAMLLLLIGQLGELIPRLLEQHPVLAMALRHLDLRAHMDALARGAVSSAVLVLYATLAVTGLMVATTVAVWGRRRRTEKSARLTATLLIAAAAVAVNVLAARHPLLWDLTRDRVHSLEPRSQEILAAVGPARPGDSPDEARIDVLVVRAGLDIFADVQDQIDRLLERMATAQPALRVQRLDPALEPGRIEALAAEFALPVDSLAEGGVVVFQRGDRRRAVDLLDMAGFDMDDLGVGTLSRLRAEEAFATALLEIIDPDRPVVCHTTGHGEMALGGDAGASWAGVGRAIERDGARLQAVERIDAAALAPCRVLIIAGPTRPLGAGEALAVATFLARGGRLLLALSEALSAAGPGRSGASVPESGLELVLAEHGIALPRALVLDPGAAVDTPGQWITSNGYGDHPITSSFRDRRLTLWLKPRAVLVAETPDRPERPDIRPERPDIRPAGEPDIRPAGEPEQPMPGPGSSQSMVLVRSSERGYGETDLAALAAGHSSRDDSDLDGPVSVAVAVADEATGARIVVVGAVHALSTAMATGHGTANELLAATSVAWLSGRTRTLDIGDKTPEHVRLLMSRGQRLGVFIVCALVLPGLWAVLGALTWWWRRRV